MADSGEPKFLRKQDRLLPKAQDVGCYLHLPKKGLLLKQNIIFRLVAPFLPRQNRRLTPRLVPLAVWSRLCYALARPPFKLCGLPHPVGVGVPSCSEHGRGVRGLSLRAPFRVLERLPRKALLSKGGPERIFEKSRPLK